MKTSRNLYVFVCAILATTAWANESAFRKIADIAQVGKCDLRVEKKDFATLAKVPNSNIECSPQFTIYRTDGSALKLP